MPGRFYRGNAALNDDRGDEIGELRKKNAELERELKKARQKRTEDKKKDDDAAFRASARKARSRALALLGSGELTASERVECQSVAVECARVLKGKSSSSTAAIEARGPKLRARLSEVEQASIGVAAVPLAMRIAAGIASGSNTPASSLKGGGLVLNTVISPEAAKLRLAELRKESANL